MYLHAMGEPMPLSPGILWTLQNKKFTKKSLKPGVSLEALQWIYQCQQSDLCVDKNGQRKQIQHAYFQGEHSEKDFFFDGFFQKDSVKYYLEYNGKL